MRDDEHVNVVLRYDAAAVTLPVGETLVGRGASCFISLDDPNVSRKHFRLVVGSTLVIEDLGSKNGTRVNGMLTLGATTLKDGDEITVGERVFVVGLGGDSEEEVTGYPLNRPGRSTAPGVGVVRKQVELGERCPSCGEAVPVQATLCLGCGFEWRRGSSRGPTKEESPIRSTRRQHERRPVSIPTRFASARWEGQGLILNLSERGAFVAVPQTETVGTKCELEVRLDGELVTLRGFVRHVIHRGKKGIGVEFTGPSSEVSRWIERQHED